MGTAASDILQDRHKHREYSDRKFGLFEGQYEDPTRIEGHRDSGDLHAAVLDRKFRDPPQIRYPPPQDYQGPGLIHVSPKVWDDK